MTLQEIQQKYKGYRFKDICQCKDQIIKELYESNIVGSIVYPYSPVQQPRLIYGLETYSPSMIKYMIQNNLNLFI